VAFTGNEQPARQRQHHELELRHAPRLPDPGPNATPQVKKMVKKAAAGGSPPIFPAGSRAPAVSRFMGRTSLSTRKKSANPPVWQRLRHACSFCRGRSSSRVLPEVPLAENSGASARVARHRPMMSGPEPYLQT
jgi:hypothetical protein